MPPTLSTFVVFTFGLGVSPSRSLGVRQLGVHIRDIADVGNIQQMTT